MESFRALISKLKSSIPLPSSKLGNDRNFLASFAVVLNDKSVRQNGILSQCRLKNIEKIQKNDDWDRDSDKP